jgi:hypothetical protein
MKIEIRAVDNGFLFTMSGDVRNRQPRPGCSATDLSAPFAHDYAGIPDQGHRVRYRPSTHGEYLMTKAPFSQDQINHIHELTCTHGHGRLDVHADGLHCPVCDYTQDWVPEGVADGSFLQSQQALHSIFFKDQ